MRQFPRNVATSIDGLIIASAVIAASDPAAGDKAAAVAELVAFSVLAFFVAHVYALLLGSWSKERRAPGRQQVRQTVLAQSPTLTVIAVPIAILLLGVFDAVDDQNAINLALYVCVGELAAIAWYASRGAGASRPQSLIAVLVAVLIGAGIIVLKAALH